MGSRESSRPKLFKIHHARAFVFSDSMCVGRDSPCIKQQRVFQFASGLSIVNKADQTPQKASMLNSSIANSTSILVYPQGSCWRRSNITSRRLSATIDQKCKREDVPQPHHFHGHDERVGSCGHAGTERRRAHPTRSRTFRQSSTLLVKILDIRRSKRRKHLEIRIV